MKKIITLLLLVTLFIGCRTTNYTQNISTPNGKMIGYTMEITYQQLDSISSADNISNDLSKWIMTTFNDFETNKRIVKYVYMKDDYNTYTILEQNGKLKIVKRTIISE